MPKRSTSSLVNFYAVEDLDGKPLLFKAPVPTKAADILAQLNKQRQREKLAPLKGPAVHTCYDPASRRIYLPEGGEKSDPYFAKMFAATRLVIDNSYGGDAAAPVIRGDPLRTIRVLHTSDFPNAWRFINRLTNNQAINLPVVQANLDIMPATAKRLNIPANHQGRYVGKDEGSSISFMGNNPDGTEVLLHAQQTPFILINLGKETSMTPAHKERIVITGYREGMGKEFGEVSVGRITGSEFFHIEFFIYIGWPMEDICHILLNKVSNLPQLLEAGEYIVAAAKHIASMGYKDISEPPHYYAFKPGPKYPEGLLQNSNIVKQTTRENGWVVLQSQISLDLPTFTTIFACLPNSPVITARYEPARSTFAFTDDPSPLSSDAPAAFQALCASGAKDSQIAGHGAPGPTPYKFSIEVVGHEAAKFTRRRLSDFPQVEDTLRQACARLSKSEGKEIKFRDMEVVVGPWQSELNVSGGYMDPDRFRAGGIPWDPLAQTNKQTGARRSVLPIYPPAILIDNESAPTSADQANVLIHEYWHYIYIQDLKLAGGENPKDEKGEEHWYKYLTMPTERVSHTQEIKYMLSVGMTKEEAILSFFSNQTPRLAQLPRARQYAEYADEAERQLQQEESDDIVDAEDAQQPV